MKALSVRPYYVLQQMHVFCVLHNTFKYNDSLCIAGICICTTAKMLLIQKQVKQMPIIELSQVKNAHITSNKLLVGHMTLEARNLPLDKTLEFKVKNYEVASRFR